MTDAKEVHQNIETFVRQVKEIKTRLPAIIKKVDIARQERRAKQSHRR